MIHAQLPLRVPCYDFVLLTEFGLVALTGAFGHSRLVSRDGR